MMRPVAVFLPNHLVVEERCTDMTELIKLNALLSIGKHDTAEQYSCPASGIRVAHGGENDWSWCANRMRCHW